MRGKNRFKQLTKTIIPEDQPALFPVEEEISLHDKKVKLLIARYCYYITLTGPEAMIYDNILKKLEEEFFISTGRIVDLLTENAEECNKLRKEAPKKAWYAIQWTHIVW